MDIGSTTSIIQVIFEVVFGTVFFVLFSIGFGYIFLIWLRNKNREKESLNSVLLQVSLPRDNEIKIDAAEQLFAALASVRKHKKLDFLKASRTFPLKLSGCPEIFVFMSILRRICATLLKSKSTEPIRMLK